MGNNLATLVEDFRRWGPHTAVVRYSGNRRYAVSYGFLAQSASRFAAYLEKHQVGPEHRVLLWGQNSAEWMAAFFGCVLRGAVVVPLDAAGSGDFARRVIADVRPSLVVADRDLMGHLPAQTSGLALEDLATLTPVQEAAANPTLALDSPLQILFTSGTTGEPKGIVHTHRNVLASLTPIENEIGKYRRYERLVHPLRFLHTLPLSHVFGQFMGLWVPPLLGAEVHFETRLAAPLLMATLRRERISVLAAVPRVLALMRLQLEVDEPKLPASIEAARGSSAWKRWWLFRRIHRRLGLKFWAFVCGGAALPPELERFWNALGFVLIQGYGMTETTALITLNHPLKTAQGSIGKALPGREVKIGPDGEVLVRGDVVSRATWQNGQIVERDDPWLATGDLAEKTPSDELKFLGRKGEAIVTATGVNIFPQDLERALESEPGVHAAAVLGIDTANGREPLAVLSYAGSREQAQVSVQHANRSLAEYQRVRRFELWPEPDLPRTSTGKVQKRRIAAWLEERRGNAVHGKTTGEDWLLQWIASLTGENIPASDESRLEEDLHLDSLARVQLAAAIGERTGSAGGEDEFQAIQTVGELRRWAGLSAGMPAAALSGTVSSAASTVSASVGPAVPHAVREFIYPKWPWSAPAALLRLLFQECVMRPLVWLLAKPRVRRDEIIDMSRGPVLLIANHLTTYDVPLVLYALPFALRRRTAIAMSGEMLDDWKHGRSGKSSQLDLPALAAYWLVTALFNVFPLPRSAGFQRSFSHAGEAFDRGFNVLVFPEGKRSDSGRLQPFRGGIGLLVNQSHVPVLPVALAGLGELKMRGKGWFRSGRLEVRVGALMQPQGAPDSITQALEEVVAGMLKRTY